MPDRGNDFWNRVAERYAARPIKDVAAYEAMLADAAARLSPADRVLEIGCGTGSAAIRLGAGVAQWHATDASEEMIRIARAKSAPPSVTFAVAPVERAFDGGRYDAVCALLILHLVDDLDTTLASIREHLRPGGVLLSKTYCLGDMNPVMRYALIPALQAFGLVPPVKAFTAEHLRHKLTEAGLTIEADRTFGSNRHAHYIVARRPA